MFISSILLSADETKPHIFSALYTFMNLQLLVLKSANQEKNCCRKNKTHKKLIGKLLFGIRLSVTKVTAIETNKGIGERSREALGESKGRAVCCCYDALS